MKREDFRPTMAEHINALNAGFALMEHIQALRLAEARHNRLAKLIEMYVAECEMGAYAKGAVERPMVKEHIDGELVAVYNETPE